MDPVSPFPLPQGTRMQADISRDCNSDLFSTSVDGLFGGADRIRFVSLRPPKLATIEGTPVRLVPPAHIGWDKWPERIMCIATHSHATEDSWAHAVDKCHLGLLERWRPGYHWETT